jgi:peptidoglycan biosynthesis protein MviN/MurJ (putative lipid II flippase)
VSALSLGFGSASAAGIGMAGTVLAVLAFALPGEGATSILAGTFFALRDTRTPVIVTIAAVVTSVSLAVLTSPSLGVAAPALGIVVASLLEPIVLFALLRRRLPGLDAMRLAWSGRFLAGAVLAGGRLAGAAASRRSGARPCSGARRPPAGLPRQARLPGLSGPVSTGWACSLGPRLVARLRTAGG